MHHDHESGRVRLLQAGSHVWFSPILTNRSLLAAAIWSSFGWLLFLSSLASNASERPAAALKSLQSEYIVDSWQTEQGLPDNYVNSIAQTPDGYLWVATFNGLARFNGVEFVVFDAANTPELPSSRTARLEVDRIGRLWIFSEYGHLSYWAEGRFKGFTRSDGLPNKGIFQFREDQGGELWCSLLNSDTNYYHFVNGSFKLASGTNSFFRQFGGRNDIHGNGWAIQGNLLFGVLSNAVVESPVPGFDGSTGTRLIGASDGGIWVIANRVQKFRAGVWEDFAALPVATDHFGSTLEDRTGNLWIGTGFGELWRMGTNRVFQRFK